MTERARECAKCEHHIPLGSHELDDDWPIRCLVGHRARFYKAVGYPGRPWDDIPAGYRRICSDFEERSER